MAIKLKVEFLSIKKKPFEPRIHIKQAPKLLVGLRGCEGELPRTWH